MVIPAGFMATAMSGGDFWAKNAGTTQALVGQKVFVNNLTGQATFAAAGSQGATAATGTGAIITQSITIQGTINGDLLTVAGSGTLPLVAGAILSGTSSLGNVATNTQVISQVSGSVTGGVGTYRVNIGEQTVGGTAVAITATYGLLSITTLSSGVFSVGDLLQGSGVTVGTTITQLGTGTGGVGTYYVSPSQAMGSSGVWVLGFTETKWIAMSEGLAGELVKISDHALG